MAWINNAHDRGRTGHDISRLLRRIEITDKELAQQAARISQLEETILKGRPVKAGE